MFRPKFTSSALLVITDNNQLKFGANEQSRIPNAHDVPVGRARLSRS